MKILGDPIEKASIILYLDLNNSKVRLERQMYRHKSLSGQSRKYNKGYRDILPSTTRILRHWKLQAQPEKRYAYLSSASCAN